MSSDSPSLEHLETEQGNTKTLAPSSKTSQPNQCLHWFFTWNKYEKKDIETLETLFNFLCHKYCFQEETGANGTPHLQGVISLKKRARWTEFGLPNKIHWEKVVHVTQSYIYCSKESTRTGGVYTLNYHVPKRLELITPSFWWQLEILDILKTPPDDRRVHWYWSKAGGLGKSQFAKYLVANENCLFFEEGKKADIMKLIFDAPDKRLERIVIDVPRDNGNNVSYKSIESIKNGMIYSSKYEGGYKLFNSPHLIVFANEPPQIERLSQDRWFIKRIDYDIDNDSDMSDEYWDLIDRV